MEVLPNLQIFLPILSNLIITIKYIILLFTWVDADSINEAILKKNKKTSSLLRPHIFMIFFNRMVRLLDSLNKVIYLVSSM